MMKLFDLLQGIIYLQNLWSFHLAIRALAEKAITLARQGLTLHNVTSAAMQPRPVNAIPTEGRQR
jgi:hypothetical protein